MTQSRSPLQITFFISLVFFILSCSSQKNTNKLDSKGKNVQTRMPMYGSCKKMGKVKGRGQGIYDVEVDARNKAGKLGANYIDLDIPRGDPAGFFAEAQAYRCHY